MRVLRRTPLMAMMAAVVALSGCGDSGLFGRRHSELDCMERAIYFEANRSSREGMIAVGTVVMNRVNSAQYPRSVCAVVGQKNQFAPGVLSRKMPHVPQVRAAAVSVMRGERHPAVRNAMFFHTYGHRFSYDNMHYVLTAGGNAFYERRPRNMVTQPVPLPPRDRIGLGG